MIVWTIRDVVGIAFWILIILAVIFLWIVIAIKDKLHNIFRKDKRMSEYVRYIVAVKVKAVYDDDYVWKITKIDSNEGEKGVRLCVKDMNAVTYKILEKER